MKFIMYSLIKHYKGKISAVLFETTCESMARMLFNKSAALLKKNESLELKHDGELIEYRQAPRYGHINNFDDASVGAMP